MTDLTPSDKAALKEVAEKATPGPWDTDIVQAYDGNGKFMSYIVGCGPPDKWKAIVDTMNSDVVVLNEEHDIDMSMCWDEQGKRNARFIAAANPSTILALLFENNRLREALKPSAETKAAYIGEFSFNVEGYDFENEVDTTHKVQVPWTVIKEIMAAISARAGLEQKP